MSEACEHPDRPKTYYMTQGSTQIAAPSGACVTSGNGVPLAVDHGLLCDPCAKKAGLSPCAFSRDLELTS